MRAALDRRNQVDVAFLRQLAFGQPGDREIDRGVFALAASRGRDRAADSRCRRASSAGSRAGRSRNAIRSFSPVASSVRRTVRPAQSTAFARSTCFSFGSENLRRVEILRIGPEAQRRAGLLLADAADDAEVARAIAVLEIHAVDLAVAADRDFDARRQRIDDRNADAVQAAGELVVACSRIFRRRAGASGSARRPECLPPDARRPACRGRRRLTSTEPSVCTMTSTVLAWPDSASSTELSMTSCARWFGRVVSVYMPGRRLTGSRPERTSMSAAL